EGRRLDQAKNPPAVAHAALAAETVTRALVGRTVAEVERDLILETLKHCLGNRTHAANILGISIRTLRNKLNEYAGDGVPVPPPGAGEARLAGERRRCPTPWPLFGLMRRSSAARHADGSCNKVDRAAMRVEAWGRGTIASRLLPTCALKVPISGKPEIGGPPPSFETPARIARRRRA